MATARRSYALWHGEGIVYRRHSYEWVLPAIFQADLRYDPTKVPVVINSVEIGPDNVSIWEMSGERLRYDRRVFARGVDNESHYLRMSIDRIRDGYCGSAALPVVSFV